MRIRVSYSALGQPRWKSPDKVAGCYGNSVENEWLALGAVCGLNFHFPKIGRSDFSAGKKVAAEPPRKPRRSFPHLLLRLLLLLLLGLAGVAAVCHLTDMRKEAMCAPVTVAVDNGLLWVRERAGELRQLLKNLPVVAKEFHESGQASKN